MKYKITIFLFLIIMGCKQRSFYSTYYYVLSGKHIYLGMTKDEIESEIGEIRDVSEYTFKAYERIENISYKGTTMRVVNLFIMEDNILKSHSFEVLTNFQTAKLIVDKYTRIPNINLEKQVGVLFYSTLPNYPDPSAMIIYKEPYLKIRFFIND